MTASDHCAVNKTARWRVLVYPGATEIALELRQALAWCKEVELFSAGAPGSNHASFVFAQHFHARSVHDCDWLDDVVRIVSEREITHIFPAHDDALLSLAQNAGRLSAKIVSSPVATCTITRSKSATARHLRDVLPTPRLFGTPQEVASFPVFVKPDRGQGSQRAAVARSCAELHSLLRLDDSAIILEHLPGREFTVDCFSDRQRGLLYASGRERRRVRAGIAMNSIFVDDARFKDYALRINSAMQLHGAWFFQLKADVTGVLKLLEVAPRIAGTSGLSRARGVNLPLLSLYEAERIPTRIVPQKINLAIDRALVNRYQHDLAYDTIYVDFDDTLIVRGRLNTNLVRFIYQCIDRRCTVVLLTRCTGDLPALLRWWRLEGAFDEIVHLRAGESKAKFIKSDRAVLIDDSFSERLDVHTKTRIPVFDLSMIEVLLDDRV